MKAALCAQYGPPEAVTITDIPTPQINDNGVLVRVKNTTVTAADRRIRSATFPDGFGVFARLFFGLRGPRVGVLGNCFSGVVESVGKNVADLKPGDEVCGVNGIKMGAHAEYIAVDGRKSLVLKPKGISHADAAGMLFGGTAALYFLRDQARLQAGESILINGASGAVGTNAVQLAKHLGANVTGVTSGSNAELVRSLGAERIIDYTKENVQDSDLRYDVVLDAVGNIRIKDGLKLLTKNGRLVLMAAGLSEMLRSARYGKVRTGTATEKKADIEFLLRLMEEGALKVIVDGVYTLDDIRAAHAHAGSGNKTGNVIVEVG